MTEKKNRALTGDRPTGKLHLGHLVGSIQNRLKLQEEVESFYMVADLQALTDNAENPDKVRSNVLEVALDNIAAGLDPSKTTLFIQSQIPQIPELTLYFLNLVTLARLKRNPTVKDEMKQKGFEDNVPVGFLAYPISQAADILCVKANMVPGGEDQAPIIEQDNEIIRKFNALYGDVFDEITLVPSETPRLKGLDGKAKMSKSLGNVIFLSDSPKEIERKVMDMYTDPLHVKAEDPGHLEGNIVFEYLDIFDTRKEEVADLKKRYEAGGLGDVEIKKRLIRVLEDIIAPIREKRESLAKDPARVMNILEEGSNKVRSAAENTLKEVREAIGIRYF